MKDYYQLRKQEQKIKDREMQFFAWILTIILVIVFLWVMFSITGPAPIVDGHL